MFFRIGILLSLLAIGTGTLAQDSSALVNPKVASAYLKQIGEKTEYISQQLEKKTSRTLKKVAKQNSKILHGLYSLDSTKAKQLKSQIDQLDQNLQTKLKSTERLRQYIPSLDTLSTSLKFLTENQKLVSGQGQKKLTDALAKIEGMEGQLQKAEELKKFLKERRRYLTDQLHSMGFGKELKRLNKQAYYYAEQLNEYKELLKDHRKAEKKMLALLNKTKFFKEFMRKNSMLASLFRMQGDPGDPSSFGGAGGGLAGLQTRAQVSNLIQQQIAAGGPNAQQQLQQNLQTAQSQLSSLKNKMNQLGKSNSDDPMPEGFKPNNQKTKSFWNRVELGTNVQSQKANGYFPVTSDIGLSAAYKLNDQSIIGIGGAYKLGLGRNIRNINISHQGAGIRSFIDWKIKGSFWVSGGYEMNYRSEFQNVDELRNLDAWQQSGLIGLSKVVSLKTKFFKKTKLQLLWDMLSYQQVPRTQPVLFRVGYSFK